jgi:hypothetical protein
MMLITRRILLMLPSLFCILAGCSAPAISSYYDPTVGSALQSSAPGDVATQLVPAAAEGSLFKEDTEVLSNEQLAQVMGQKVEWPEHSKIVVVRYGRLPYWWGWSESFMHANEQIDQQLLQRLGSSPRVASVSYLPSMLLPPQMTIPRLRQSAARCQADLLLIYRTDTRSYDRDKFFGPGETRAYCTVEAILLDTRSGLIPYSTTTTETFSAKKTSNDIDFTETIAKASQQATSKAWLEMADAVRGYMDSAPAGKVATAR